VDPASAAALAANVVQILTAVSDPVVNAIKKRALRKALNKTVARVSLEFVAEFPGAGIAMQASSAPAIAAELRRLLTAGAPLEPQTLINEWMNKGYFEHADADRLATNYTERLHDALIAIDGFRPLMVASATLTIAQRADEAERRAQRSEEREVARAYFDAADGYFRSALSLFAGDEIAAQGSVYDAGSLIERIDLIADWRIKEKFKDLRYDFDDLVEQRYENFVELWETGADPEALRASLEEVRLGAVELRRRVKVSYLS